MQLYRKILITLHIKALEFDDLSGIMVALNTGLKDVLRN